MKKSFVFFIAVGFMNPAYSADDLSLIVGKANQAQTGAPAAATDALDRIARKIGVRSQRLKTKSENMFKNDPQSFRGTHVATTETGLPTRRIQTLLLTDHDRRPLIQVAAEQRALGPRGVAITSIKENAIKRAENEVFREFFARELLQQDRTLKANIDQLLEEMNRVPAEIAEPWGVVFNTNDRGQRVFQSTSLNAEAFEQFLKYRIQRGASADDSLGRMGDALIEKWKDTAQARRTALMNHQTNLLRISLDRAKLLAEIAEFDALTRHLMETDETFLVDMKRYAGMAHNYKVLHHQKLGFRSMAMMNPADDVISQIHKDIYGQYHKVVKSGTTTLGEHRNVSLERTTAVTARRTKTLVGAAGSAVALITLATYGDDIYEAIQGSRAEEKLPQAKK